MRISDVLSGIVFLIFGLFVIFQAGRFPSIGGGVLSPGFFPSILGAGLALGGAIVAGKALLRKATSPIIHFEPWMKDGRKITTIVLIGLLIPFFAFASPLLGTVTTSFIILMSMMLVQKQKLMTSFIVSVIVSLSVYLLFSKAMGVPLPVGIIERILP